MKKKPKWYHWTLLALCATGMLTMGILSVTEVQYRWEWYLVDDVVLWLLGCGFITFSLGLILRRRWAFVGAMLCLGGSILEAVIMHYIVTSSLTFSPVMTTLILLFFGVPLVMLAWLQVVFVQRKTESAPRELTE